MNEKFEKRLRVYRKILTYDYIYFANYDDEEIFKINHLKIIIDLLDGKPSRLLKENFLDEVERYERKFFGEYVRSRTPHQIRETVNRLRENYEIVEILCKEYNKPRKQYFNQNQNCFYQVKPWQRKKN
jgi:NAD-specific glutamate dehydrogenase